MLYFILLYLAILYLLKDKIKRKTLIILSTIPLLAIIWTRYGLGADYFSYEDMYNKLEVQSLGSLFNNYYNIEVGFKLLMWPFRLLHLPFWVFLGLINSSATLLIVKWIDDNSEDPALSILLFYSMFFLVWVLSALRQSIVLAVGLYFLFNRKKNLSILQTIILVMVLFSIHNSALFLLFFVILRKFNWNKKFHLAFLSTALITTLLPMGKIVSIFSFLPGVSKIVNSYLDSSSAFYDFPGLVRLGLFLIVFYFYDRLEDKKEVADSILFGFSTYFLLKFSEITASRATIFTFFLIIIIAPDIMKTIRFNQRAIQTVLIPIFVITGTTVYFTKEFRTMISQTEYLDDVTFLTYPNIFYKDITKFGSLQAYETSIREASDRLYSQYDKENMNREVLDYSKEQTYLTLKTKNNYVIIDQDGNYLLEEQYKYESTVYEGVLASRNYNKQHFFDYIELTDLTKENRSEQELKDLFLSKYEKETFNPPVETRMSSDVSSIPKEFKKFYPVDSDISRVVLNKLDNGFEYYLMRIDYKERTSFIFFDSDMKSLLPFPSKVANKYDNQGFLQISVNDIPMIINKNGEIIWWGELK